MKWTLTEEDVEQSRGQGGMCLRCLAHIQVKLLDKLVAITVLFSHGQDTNRPTLFQSQLAKVKKALYSHLVGSFSQIAKWPKMYKILSFLYFCLVSFDWFDMVNQYRYSILQYNATSTII